MEYLIPISVLLFGLVGIWVVWFVGLRKDLTLSLHVAQSPITRTVFAVVGSLATLLVSWSLFTKLLPHYQASSLSYLLYGLVMFGFLVAALVPHIQGSKKGIVHSIAAWGMCYAIPLAILNALFWQLSEFVYISGIILLVILTILLILSVTKKELKRSMLMFQMVYLGIFFSFLLLIAYF